MKILTHEGFRITRERIGCSGKRFRFKCGHLTTLSKKGMIDKIDTLIIQRKQIDLEIGMLDKIENGIRTTVTVIDEPINLGKKHAEIISQVHDKLFQHIRKCNFCIYEKPSKLSNIQCDHCDDFDKFVPKSIDEPAGKVLTATCNLAETLKQHDARLKQICDQMAADIKRVNFGDVPEYQCSNCDDGRKLHNNSKCLKCGTIHTVKN